MNITDKKRVEDLIKSIDDKNNINTDILYLYSIINSNTKVVEKIERKFKNNHIDEDQCDELEKMFSSLKISNKLLTQMISTYMKKEDIDYIKNENKLDYHFEISKNKSELPIRWLLSYNDFLSKNHFLVNEKLVSFLGFLEDGQADNASLVLEELSCEQIKTIPKKIREWIKNNSEY